MIKSVWNSKLRKLLFVSGIALGFFPGATHAQQSRAGKQPSLAGPGKASTSMELGRPSGIEVHGHWIIQVRTAEGKLRSRYEFDNSFVGRQAITAVLSKQNSVGYWIVSLQSQTVGGPCAVPNQNQAGPCEITEPGFNAASAGRYSSAANLKLTVPDVNANNNSAPGKTFTLSGSVTVQAGSIIEQVQTLVSLCPPLQQVAAPQPCNAGTQVVFTQAGKGAGLPAGGIQVLTGDNVQITVDISFTG